MLDKKNSVIKALEQVLKEYKEIVAEDKEHMLGSPIPYMLMALLKTMKEEEVGKKNKEVISDMIDKLEMTDAIEETFDWVSRLQFKGCYNQDLIKITIVMNEGKLIERRAIVDGLKQLGGILRHSEVVF